MRSRSIARAGRRRQTNRLLDYPCLATSTCSPTTQHTWRLVASSKVRRIRPRLIRRGVSRPLALEPPELMCQRFRRPERICYTTSKSCSDQVTFLGSRPALSGRLEINGHMLRRIAEMRCDLLNTTIVRPNYLIATATAMVRVSWNPKGKLYCLHEHQCTNHPPQMEGCLSVFALKSCDSSVHWKSDLPTVPYGWLL